MSNALSRLAKQYEGDTCHQFDALLEQRAQEAEQNRILSYARAYNSERISRFEIPDDIRGAVLALALAI